jgi:hypothetical protein
MGFDQLLYNEPRCLDEKVSAGLFCDIRKEGMSAVAASPFVFRRKRVLRVRGLSHGLLTEPHGIF